MLDSIVIVNLSISTPIKTFIPMGGSCIGVILNTLDRKHSRVKRNEENKTLLNFQLNHEITIQNCTKRLNS